MRLPRMAFCFAVKNNESGMQEGRKKAGDKFGSQEPRIYFGLVPTFFDLDAGSFTIRRGSHFSQMPSCCRARAALLATRRRLTNQENRKKGRRLGWSVISSLSAFLIHTYFLASWF
jgi:hypothetical protein